MFIQNITTKPEGKTDDGNTIRIVLLFKDQIAANAVCRRLRDLSNKIAVTFQPLFVSKKFDHRSQHCVVYKFKRDVCDPDYFSYTVSATP